MRFLMRGSPWATHFLIKEESKMDIFDKYYETRREAVKEVIVETVIKNLDFMGIDFNSIANTQAITILDEVRNVLINQKSDKETVAQIRQIFDNHKVSY